MAVHVSQLVPGRFYQLRRIKTIRKFISTSAAVILVNSFIFYRFDYCDSILAGLSAGSESVSAKLRCPFHIWSDTSDHTTDLLRDNQHWLRVPQRIAYKLCLITYKALNDRRMSDYCIRVVADKRVRSS